MSNDNFQVKLQWQPQNKNFSYKEYSREYTVEAEGKPQWVASAAPSYLGNPSQYNPEEMLIAALSSCHMLSYLALAANANIEVSAYEDQADGSLEKDGMSFKFKEVILRPKITITDAANKEKATALHDKAHHICFISNSVNFAVTIQPEIIV